MKPSSAKGIRHMKKRIIALIFCIACTLIQAMLFSMPVHCEGQEEDRQKRVLFISSYTLAWPTVPYQIKGIQESLDHDIALEYAFMGTKTYDDSEYRKLFYERLKYQIGHVEPYDVIIVGDDAAYDFAIEYRTALFPDTPIIFEGVNNIESVKKESQDPLLTGVVEEVPISENIEIARKINPDADKVVSILDNSASGLADQDQMKAIYRRLKKANKSKLEIFTEISDKIHRVTLQDDIFCQIVVSYFIQSCEVF